MHFPVLLDELQRVLGEKEHESHKKDTSTTHQSTQDEILEELS